MKHVPLVLSALLAATMTAIAGPATTALPKDSVYQLPVRLTDQSGKTWAWSARRGRPQIVAMFYTSCQYICPLIVDSGKAVERTLTPGERANMGILLVSMDPARDTPDALTAVVKKRGLDTRQWTLASPAPSQVRDVANVLGVRFRKLEDGEFNHTSALILLDADGRVVARTEQVGSKADPEFLQEVRRLSHEGPGAVRPQGVENGLLPRSSCAHPVAASWRTDVAAHRKAEDACRGVIQRQLARDPGGPGGNTRLAGKVQRRPRARPLRMAPPVAGTLGPGRRRRRHPPAFPL